MKINGIPVTVDTKKMGGALVLVYIDRKEGNEEQENILEKRLCDICGGRKLNQTELMLHPDVSPDAILFTGDAWTHTVPYFNKITR